jgi:glucose/arabinose dehydrogenase
MPRRRHRRAITLLAFALAAAMAFAVAAGAAGGPIAASGAPVAVVATGLQTTTAFAFGDATMFAGEGPAEPTGAPGGGLFVVAGGIGRRLADSPRYVYGLAWHAGKLYVSTGPSIVVLSGWNGTAFAASRTIYAGAPQFNGFSGIAFGPDGRLYAGLLLKEPTYDHAKDPYPLSQAVVSMSPSGKHLRFVARGLRQPFQMVFPVGSRWPYVSDLGQDAGPTPPDEIVVAKSGENYGFPTCIWLTLSVCTHFTEPLILLPQHASPMGIGSVGDTLYVALYTGIAGSGPEVVTIPTAGGSPTPFLTGFSASIIALAIHDGKLYVGEQDGTIYSVAL